MSREARIEIPWRVREVMFPCFQCYRTSRTTTLKIAEYFLSLWLVQCELIEKTRDTGIKVERRRAYKRSVLAILLRKDDLAVKRVFNAQQQEQHQVMKMEEKKTAMHERICTSFA
jgi:hypothetical protein